MPDLAADWGQTAYLAAALFVAAFVRGYSGFGFSAVFIVFAALIINPVPLIPVVFSCEILMTAFQARGIRAHVDWARVRALLLGSAVAIVPAIAIMARLDADQARLAVSAIVLLFGLLLLSGWQLRRPVGSAGNCGIGAVAGIANSAGVGGLPVGAFLAAQPIAPAVFRATMIVFLTGLDLMSLPVMAANGLVGPGTAAGIALAFPVLGAGIWAGTHVFATASQGQFRRGVVILLTTMAGFNITRFLT